MWALISVVAFVTLSLIIGVQQSVWFDEAYSINLAKRPFEDLIYLTSVDVHPPVYYILLKFWGSIFGFSEFSLRIPSVLAMALAIFLGIVLIKKVIGGRAAIFAAIFLSLSPMLIRYGFEIRMYALATLIATSSSLILWEILNTEKVRKKRILQVIYALLVALGMFSLYYTIVIWVTHLIYLIYRTKKAKKPIFKQDFWLVYILAVLIFLPWVSTVLKQLGNGALAPISERLDLSNIIGIITFNFIYRPAWQTDQIFGVFILAFVVLMMILIVKNKFKNKEEQSGFSFLAFLAGVPILLEFLICLVSPMYVERYLVYSAPFLIILVATLCANVKKARMIAAYVVVLLVFGVINLWQIGNYNFQRLQKPDIKIVAEEVEDINLPVLTNSPYEAIELGYYLDENSYFYAPYDRLSGGYAVLDGSEMQIKSEEEFEKLPSCVEYVFYGDGEVGEMLENDGYTVSIFEEQDGRALKHKTMCKN